MCGRDWSSDVCSSDLDAGDDDDGDDDDDGWRARHKEDREIF